MAQYSPATESPPPPEDVWREIEELVDQIARLSRSDVAPGAFSTELLGGAVSALAAVGGVIWRVKPGPELELDYQINLAATHLTESDDSWRRHAELVYEIVEARQSKAVPPYSGTGQGGVAANPTEYLVLVCPLFVEGEPFGVIEIFQRPGTSRAAHAGYLRFLDALGELAVDYQRNRQLRLLQDRAGAWGQFEQFAERVHGSLNLNETAYFIANEGRKLIGCDRLSVLRLRGRRCRMLAVSGLDTFERRANVVRHCEQLATAVVAAGDPLWYEGDGSNLSPQIEAALQPFLDEAHARVAAVLPLTFQPPAEGSRSDRNGRPAEPETIGALVVERFEADTADAGWKHRIDAVSRHSGLALNNALAHEGLPFFPVLKAIQKASWFAKARNLPKTALIAGAVLGVVAALAFIPADFNASGRGELQPKVRRDVFARADGIIDNVYVWHARKVAADEALVQLRNLDLEYKQKQLLGDHQTATQRLNTVRTARLRARESTPDAEERRRQYSAEEEEFSIKVKSLEEQRAILERQQAELLIKSPIAGTVLTWDVDQLLEARPVQRGQNLMRVADLDGPWVLEIQVPDGQVGHVLEAAKTAPEGLPVTFVLATDPDVTYRGSVETIDLSTRTSEQEGATVLVTVAIDRNEIAHLRPGLVAVPKIYCGRRSLGYVWFHGLIDWVKTRIL
ncbi:MAG TPA: HlyD family efflux transporter periplasmic adaptor subunit [Planctomycetaceae bacterium]|nr:HlyD family efflux transporter periplasmic adaptor subunit [Planctomycetaceae bacterium]